MSKFLAPCENFIFEFITAGEVVNLLSVDCQKLQDAALFINFMWASPLQVGLAIFFLYQTIGWSVFVGKYQIEIIKMECLMKF